MVVQLEDVFGVREQANLPGTTDEHPNWRRKLPVALEQLGRRRALHALDAHAASVASEPCAGAAARAAARRSCRCRLQRSRARPTACSCTATSRSPTRPRSCRTSPRSASATSTARRTCARGRAAGTATTSSTTGAQTRRSARARTSTRMVATLTHHGMGHLCDIVPNHMGVMGADNAWWMDVLENGPASRYAEFFDIDWTPRDRDSPGKVLLPVLGDHYGAVLERGELALALRGRDAAASRCATSSIACRSTRATYRACSSTRCAGAARGHGRRGRDGVRARRRTRCRRCRRATSGAGTAQAPRRRDSGRAEGGGSRAGGGACPRWRDAIGERRRAINGTPGERGELRRAARAARAQALPARVLARRLRRDQLPPLLRHQRARGAAHGERRGVRGDARVRAGARAPTAWSTACASTIPTACSTRRTISSGCSSAMRERAKRARRNRRGTMAASTWWSRRSPRRTSACRRLGGARHHRLPLRQRASTACSSTPARRDASIAPGAPSRSDEAHTFEEAAYRGRRAIMAGALASRARPCSRCARCGIARADRRTRDFTLQRAAPGAGGDRRALSRSTAPTSIDNGASDAGPALHRLGGRPRAAAEPRRRRRASSISCTRVLLGERTPTRRLGATARRCRDFAMRFQQFTAPVPAKGVEDTAFYRYNRLVSLNEVGGDPDQFGITVRALPRRQRATARRTGRTRCSPPRRTTTSAPRTCARAST